MTGWSTNTYDATAWAKMEAAGAVFLPAAGYRYGMYVYGVGNYGRYWSSTAIGSDYAWYVDFNENFVSPGDYRHRSSGQSVRLVCE